LSTSTQQQFGDPGGAGDAVDVGRSRLLQRVVDARLDPRAGGPVGRRHHERGRERPQAWVEERVVAGQVAADQLGRCPAAAVVDDGHDVPRGRVDEGADRHGLGVRRAAHPVLVVVGQHDHVAGRRPESLAVAGLDPASPASHGVEEHHPGGARVQDRCGVA